MPELPGTAKTSVQLWSCLSLSRYDPVSAEAFLNDRVRQLAMHRNFDVRNFTLAVLCTLLPGSIQAADIPSAQELDPLGLEVRWNSQAVLNVRRDTVAHVSNDENNIYIQSSSGMLTAFDAENGRRLWSTQIGRGDEPAMAAVSNKDTVIVVAGPVVYGYNKFSGTQLLEFRLPRQPSASPVMGEGIFYVPVTGGALYAFETATLEYQFRFGTLPPGVALPQAWRYICNEKIVHPPVLGLQFVAFATQSGNLHVVNTSGVQRVTLRYQLFLQGPISAPLALVDNARSSSIIAMTDTHRVFSVELMDLDRIEDGQPAQDVQWTYPLGRPMKNAPIAVRNDLFVVAVDGTLTQFSRDPAKTFWGRPVEIPQYEAPVLIGAGMVDAEIDPQLQAGLSVGGQGVRVTTVVPGSPADQAGLQAGDLLVTINRTPAASVTVAKEVISRLPLRFNRPIEVIRVSTGMQLMEQDSDSPLQISDTETLTRHVVLAGVARDSAAMEAGLKQGDILVRIGDELIESVEGAQRATAAAAPGTLTLQLLRDGTVVPAKIELTTEKHPLQSTRVPTVSLQTLQLTIPVEQWVVDGITSLSAVGRFCVFGIDRTNRLVAYDRATSEMLGRVAVPGYAVHLNNSITDQIILISSTGDVLCLREIGPTVRMPRGLSDVSNRATVKEVLVTKDDPIEPTGTVVATVAFPDGAEHQISANNKGLVQDVYVKVGDVVLVDDPLIRIADDKFATYHQRPLQQPVDAELQSSGGNAAPAENGNTP